MKREHNKEEEQGFSTQEIEALLQEKDPRLPKSVRRYIRDLKQAGKFEEAMRKRNDEVQKKKDKRERIIDELNGSVYGLAITKEPKEEIDNMAKALWLMDAARIIAPEERQAELGEIYDIAGSELEGYLQERMPQIRNEVASRIKSF
ncbi:hypothetical protein HYS03_02690 [Candidatus Woesebacteria bacterium]|nr:hypothetical protein [Candidatus Woesebacteria bacterium]QQG47252.1 MAG: hypothetical protein HY044_03955 [Candidatus Woesebacteria bacterium]